MPSINRPKRNVDMAAQRNHHSARHVSLSKASLRACGLNCAYAGVCTKLKKYSKPIQAMPDSTWSQRAMNWNPPLALKKLSKMTESVITRKHTSAPSDGGETRPETG